MQQRLKLMTDHVIICGYGRNGKSAAEALQANGIKYVIIELHSKAIAPEGQEKIFVFGDATKEDILIQAGILSARALITTMPDDADNVFTVLTAKELNPPLLIISRASNDSSIRKLKHAGAANVIMPDKIGGTHMAQLVNSPDLKEFVDTLSMQNKADSNLAELAIHKEFLCNKAELLTRFNVLVLSIKNNEKTFDFSNDTLLLDPGNKIIVLGTKTDIESLQQFLLNF
jgi:voltage-gated potassium channel